MKSKFLFPGLAVLFLVIMGLFFLVDPSYEKSIEAKYYYNTGNYKKAYKLANKAFSIDVYNRMAATIMAQSKTSIKYQKYNQQAKKYMQEINVIASKDFISDADKARMKLMSEIMVDSYVKLAPSVITDKDLVAKAAKYHDDFEKLLEKVTR
jgi:tetratricopeptide (TPR) repeat protein